MVLWYRAMSIYPNRDIYTIYTPNLGFEIAVPGREREQSRFRGSTEGVGREHRRARESIEGALLGSAEAQQVRA